MQTCSLLTVVSNPFVFQCHFLEKHFRTKFVNEITNDAREDKTGEPRSTNERENKIC